MSSMYARHYSTFMSAHLIHLIGETQNFQKNALIIVNVGNIPNIFFPFIALLKFNSAGFG